MKLGDPVPAFDDRIEWLDGVRLAPQAGRPLLVHFWSTDCPLCHDGAELVAERRAMYREILDVIAVFAPRSEATSVDIEAVRRDARGPMRIVHPCAVDVHRDLQTAFDCPFPPGYFIFDRNGKLRHRQMGNDDLDAIAALVDRLALKASSAPEA